MVFGRYVPKFWRNILSPSSPSYTGVFSFLCTSVGYFNLELLFIAGVATWTSLASHTLGGNVGEIHVLMKKNICSFFTGF